MSDRQLRQELTPFMHCVELSALVLAEKGKVNCLATFQTPLEFEVELAIRSEKQGERW